MNKQNNQQYWKRRFIQSKIIGLQSCQDYEFALNKRLNKLLYIYDRELSRWYKRYTTDLGIPKEQVAKMLEGIEFKNWDLTLDEFRKKAISGGYEKQLNQQYFNSRVASLKQMEGQLRLKATEFTKAEKDNMENELVNEYNNTYLRGTYDIQQYQGMNFAANFNKLSNSELKYIIAKPWAKDGKDFSSRLWGTYVDKLPSQLMDSLLRNTLIGSNYHKVEQDFRQRFTGMQSKNIHRLVISEMGHIQEMASADVYAAQGVEKYEYVATLESRTCTECRRLDGKVFTLVAKIDGTNYPILHPYCRCTTIPSFKDIPTAQSRWAKQGSGPGQIIKDMPYSEWLKQYAKQGGDVPKTKSKPNPKPKKVQKDKVDKTPKEQKEPYTKDDLNSMISHLNNKYGIATQSNSLYSYEDINHVNKEYLYQSLKFMDRFNDEYNWNEKKSINFKSLTTAPYLNRKGVMAYVAKDLDNNSDMVLNGAFLNKSYDAIMQAQHKMEKQGWLAKSDNGIPHTFCHEFGHVIANDLIQRHYMAKHNGDLIPANSTALKRAETSFYKDFYKQILKDQGATDIPRALWKLQSDVHDIDGKVSEYAFTNAAELFAENFVNAYCGGTKTNVGQSFKKIADKLLKK
ncbi:minor capsid protein [Apilactobacillus xinyiensis]|uniref:minor capsid protein n=1 Tax=Apilactobacillus xinyiensis TaxID=2841032 RepID=UPI00200D07F8|nr:minor capsid protein [Apilactobacillus xinyiensis]MCL0319374.1 minor capsid protein [Apilactobacillus xinyiensis]